MSSQKINFKTEEELQEAILQEKAKGTSDLEIGRKYGVTFRYIERLITRAQGLNIGTFRVSKKIKTLHPKDFNEVQTVASLYKSMTEKPPINFVESFSDLADFPAELGLYLLNIIFDYNVNIELLRWEVPFRKEGDER